MSYTYCIIDSDETVALGLQHILLPYKEFECKSVTQNSIEGLDAILQYSPDIVFIHLNNKSSSYFQMVTELYQYRNCIPTIIAISNSKDYAYDAIKNNFFDYWLLPYNEYDVRKTITRLKKVMPTQEDTSKTTLCLKSYRDFHYLDTNDIIYLKADNNSTEFIMKDGTINNAFKTLKNFENQLPKNFTRIHQSYIVNTNYISRISYGKTTCTLKHKKTEIPFSKSYRENILIIQEILTKNTISSLN